MCCMIFVVPNEAFCFPDTIAILHSYFSTLKTKYHGFKYKNKKNYKTKKTLGVSPLFRNKIKKHIYNHHYTPINVCNTNLYIVCTCTYSLISFVLSSNLIQYINHNLKVNK